MKPATQLSVDLFADEPLSGEELRKLSQQVNCSETSKLNFAEQIEQHLSSPNPRDCLATGIGLVVLGRNSKAVEQLEKAEDCLEKFFHLGHAYRHLREYNKAIENFILKATELFLKYDDDLEDEDDCVFLIIDWLPHKGYDNEDLNTTLEEGIN